MSAEFDLSRYLDVFLLEARELTAAIEEQALSLEADPSAERVQALFRSAHTLKGNSRAMGYAQIGDLAHAMENLLDRVRSNQASMTPEVGDLLLACADALGQMLDSVADGSESVIDSGALLHRLGEAGGGGRVAELPPAQLAETFASDLARLAADGDVLIARVAFAPDCPMPNVRALMAANALRDGGEVLLTFPDLETADADAFAGGFEIAFRFGAGVDAARAALERVGDVASVVVEPWRPPAGPRRGEASTVRVDVARLDELMNLVGELVIDKSRIAQLAGQIAPRGDEIGAALLETVDHIGRVAARLQEQVVQARMLPIEVVFNRYPRVIRDLARTLGKKVHIEMYGADTEVDRSVVEAIADPLLHILRNCMDHGIETPERRLAAGKSPEGRIELSARHEDGLIIVEVSDDGQGVDLARVREKAVAAGLVGREAAARMGDRETLHLIFASGLTTAEAVTDVSGRGVGMDVVRANIQRLGGLIDLESTTGAGTRFTLRLPLTLAIIRGLLAEVGGRMLVLPLASVVETLRLSRDGLRTIRGREMLMLREVALPLVRLDAFFGLESSAPACDPRVVVAGLAEKRAGLVVDRLVGEHEVVIKALSPYLGDVPGVGGASVLGDGSVALIVDVADVLGLERAA